MERVGWIYLLHFDRRYQHAGHYQGWTLDLDRRLEEHANGYVNGSPLLHAVKKEGISFRLASLEIGDRHRERALKRQGGASRRCPICLNKERRKRARPKSKAGGEHRVEDPGVLSGDAA